LLELGIDDFVAKDHKQEI